MGAKFKGQIVYTQAHYYGCQPNALLGNLAANTTGGGFGYRAHAESMQTIGRQSNQNSGNFRSNGSGAKRVTSSSRGGDNMSQFYYEKNSPSPHGAKRYSFNEGGPVKGNSQF